MKAKDLPKLIPTHVRVTQKVSYEVVYVEDFKGEQFTYGECRYEQRQIVLNKNQPPSELFATYIHELLHAISFETKGLNLTENQVRALEKGVLRVLKLNKLLGES